MALKDRVAKCDAAPRCGVTFCDQIVGAGCKINMSKNGLLQAHGLVFNYSLGFQCVGCPNCVGAQRPGS